MRKVILLIVLSVSFGNIIYIPDDYSSIQEGINNSIDHDSIIVNNGTYFEQISISHPITLAGNDNVIIDGSGYSVVINILADTVTVSGFEIIGDSLTVSGITVTPGSDNVQILSNVIHGMHAPNTSSALPASYGILSYGDSSPIDPPKNLLIDSNEIYDINAFGISLGSLSDSVIINNNFIHDIDKIDLSSYGYEEELSVGVIGNMGSWIKVENNNFSNVLLGSNLLLSSGIVTNNQYDDSIRIYLAYDEGHPIPISEENPLPSNALAAREGTFAGFNLVINAHFPKIQDAIEYADPETEIYITSGIYYENINFGGKDISLVGENIDSTIIDGGGDGAVVIFNSGETSSSMLSNLSIRNGYSDFGSGISCSNFSNPHLDKLLIYGNTPINEYDPSLVFEDCNATLTNVTVANNLGGIIIENSSVTILNSLIWNGVQYEIYLDEGGIIDISYSNIEGGFEGEGNINNNPLFCDYENHDYTLAENSPCIGTGQSGSDIGAMGIGCGEPLNINILQIPTEYILYPAYPNPFNPITTITYSIPEPTDVTIIVYDILGKQVAELINDYIPSGNHQVRWNAGINSTGVYFIKMSTYTFTQTQKVLLAR